MKKAGYMLLILPILLILMSISCAAQVDTFNLSFYMTTESVVVKEMISFKELQTGMAQFDVPTDARGLSVDIDGKAIIPNMTKTGLGNVFNINLKSAKIIRLSYVTSDFIATFKAPYNIDNLYVDLTLPENAVLQTPLSQATFSSSSAYPTPSRATTDGRSITLNWKNHGLEKDDEQSLFVRYVLPNNYIFVFIVSILGLMLVFGLIYLLFMRKKKIGVDIKDTQEIIAQSVESSEKNGNGFESHLKEDEEQVVNILKQRDGNQCEQGTLRVITGFSKAKLSVLLKELEDRKVVYKEQRGKKNLVFLRNQ
jgi:uncharacterized membrane protein